ncbi:MAG: hypothetical protein WBG90_00575 [Saonia sp.]
MKAKKNSIAIILGLCMTIVFGQTKMNPQEMADYQTDIMVKELPLNETKREDVAKINIKYAEKIVVLMEADGSMFGKIGEMKGIKKSKHAELEKILSEAQMEKLKDELEPKFRKHFKKQMNP